MEKRWPGAPGEGHHPSSPSLTTLGIRGTFSVSWELGPALAPLTASQYTGEQFPG